MNKCKYMLLGAVGASFLAVEVHAATEWNVSLWGKRRAFTENVEKLAELVEQKTNGDFKLKISYGGLSKSKENLDGISIPGILHIAPNLQTLLLLPCFPMACIFVQSTLSV